MMAIKWNLVNVSKIVASVGAINWGADALGFNIVEMLIPSNFVAYAYYIVAAAGIYALMNFKLNK